MPPMKVTDSLLIQLLIKSNGLVHPVIKSLDKDHGVTISRQAVHTRIANNPHIQKAVDDATNNILDFAESKLHQNVKKGKSSDIQFLLKTKGKDRGYVPRTESELSGQVDTESTLDLSKLDTETLKKLKDAFKQ